MTGTLKSLNPLQPDLIWSAFQLLTQCSQGPFRKARQKKLPRVTSVTVVQGMLNRHFQKMLPCMHYTGTAISAHEPAETHAVPESWGSFHHCSGVVSHRPKQHLRMVVGYSGTLATLALPPHARALSSSENNVLRSKYISTPYFLIDELCYWTRWVFLRATSHTWIRDMPLQEKTGQRLLTASNSTADTAHTQQCHTWCLSVHYLQSFPKLLCEIWTVSHWFM